MTESPEDYQKQAASFLTLVGMCIIEWSNVDDALFDIFRRCVGPYQQSAVIYYRTPGQEVRFGLTDETVKSVLPKPEKGAGGHQHHSVKAWKSAIEGYQGLLNARRRIAHQPLTITLELTDKVDERGIALPRQSYAIHVSKHEKARGRESDLALKPLRVDDLVDHFVAVAHLRDRLRAFLRDVLTKHIEEPVRPTLPLNSDPSELNHLRAIMHRLPPQSFEA